MITEQKRYPMTWAKIEAVAASATGFETITPQSARELLAERDARCVEWEQLAEERHRDILELTTDNTKQRRAAEDATATLERVRSACDTGEQMIGRSIVLAALASQPEAPKGRESGALAKAADSMATHAEYLRAELAAANARIAELSEDRDYWQHSSVAEGKSKLKVRGELRLQENATRQLSAEVARLDAALTVANARADAAEREKEALADAERIRTGQRDFAERELLAAKQRLNSFLQHGDQDKAHTLNGWLECALERIKILELAGAPEIRWLRRAETAETERDQLAARVQGLVHWYSESPSRCTPKEREVLEAMADVDEEQLRRTVEARFSTQEEKALARAELANRAAKTKRGCRCENESGDRACPVHPCEEGSCCAEYRAANGGGQ